MPRCEPHTYREPHTHTTSPGHTYSERGRYADSTKTRGFRMINMISLKILKTKFDCSLIAQNDRLSMIRVGDHVVHNRGDHRRGIVVDIRHFEGKILVYCNDGTFCYWQSFLNFTKLFHGEEVRFSDSKSFHTTKEVTAASMLLMMSKRPLLHSTSIPWSRFGTTQCTRLEPLSVNSSFENTLSLKPPCLWNHHVLALSKPPCLWNHHVLALSKPACLWNHVPVLPARHFREILKETTFIFYSTFFKHITWYKSEMLWLDILLPWVVPTHCTFASRSPSGGGCGVSKKSVLVPCPRTLLPKSRNTKKKLFFQIRWQYSLASMWDCVEFNCVRRRSDHEHGKNNDDDQDKERWCRYRSGKV